MKYLSTVAKILSAGFVLLLFNYSSCKKENSTPVCIQQKILMIKMQPKWNPPAQVDEYVYNGKRVFLFSVNCCDQFIELYDESCKYICAPSGGITGKGDGKCPDFSTAAKHVRVVWRDER